MGTLAALPITDPVLIFALAMVIFLGLNGYDFDAPEPEVVTMMLAAADHRAMEAELTAWIRRRMVALTE